MPVKLSRLDHFAVFVADLESAERFYVEMLGMQRVMKLPDQTLLMLGGVNIGLMEQAGLPAPDPAILQNPLGRAHHAFLVEEENFDASRAVLAAASIPVSDPVNWGDHRCFYFLDPSGNLLEIVTPPAVRREGPSSR